MNIVVLIKQVPDAEAIIEVASDGSTLKIEQKFAMNLFDEFAVEEALRIREKHTGTVRVISLGGPKTVEALRTAVAMGADEVVHLDDAAFLDGDGYATAFALSRAILKGPFDVILSGRQAIDSDRGEVGQMVAQFLDIPHIGGIVKLDITDGKAIAECPAEGGKEVIETTLPALFTAQKGLNEPRVPLITGVMKAMKTQIPKMTPGDLGLSAGEIGSGGSKVNIIRYYPPKKRPAVQMIPGEAREAAIEAARILIDVERVI